MMFEDDDKDFWLDVGVAILLMMALVTLAFFLGGGYD